MRTADVDLSDIVSQFLDQWTGNVDQPSGVSFGEIGRKSFLDGSVMHVSSLKGLLADRLLTNVIGSEDARSTHTPLSISRESYTDTEQKPNEKRTQE
jgi:hypothetical protein